MGSVAQHHDALVRRSPGIQEFLAIEHGQAEIQNDRAGRITADEIQGGEPVSRDSDPTASSFERLRKQGADSGVILDHEH